MFSIEPLGVRAEAVSLCFCAPSLNPTEGSRWWCQTSPKCNLIYKEMCAFRGFVGGVQKQAKTALSNEKFRELARKIEPNVDFKYPHVSSSSSFENGGAEGGGDVVGLLHSELEKEVSEQEQDEMLSKELKQLIARAKAATLQNKKSPLYSVFV